VSELVRNKRSAGKYWSSCTCSGMQKGCSHKTMLMDLHIMNPWLIPGRQSNSSSTVHGVRKFNKDDNSYIPWQCHPPWACSMVSPPNHHSARLQQGLNWSHCHWETISAVTEDPLCTYKHWVAAFIWMIDTVQSFLYLQPQQFNAEQDVDVVL